MFTIVTNNSNGYSNSNYLNKFYIIMFICIRLLLIIYLIHIFNNTQLRWFGQLGIKITQILTPNYSID